MIDLAEQAIRHGAVQKANEFGPLLELVEGLNPRIIVEIGSDKGGSLWAWQQLAHWVIAIDLPHGPFSSGVTLNDHGAVVIRGDSHDPKTLADLKTQLNGNMIDFLFIDGDHTYEGVKQDWEMYGPLAKVVGFHDIVVHDGLPQVGVHKLWAELKGKKKEFITPPANCMGIGVIWNSTN